MTGLKVVGPFFEISCSLQPIGTEWDLTRAIAWGFDGDGELSTHY